MTRLARLARRFLSLPFDCPACGGRTRHGHFVKPGPGTRGFWACSPFLQKLAEPGGSILTETNAAGLRGGKSSA